MQRYRDSEGRTIAEVARELVVGTETFRKWARKNEADRGVTPEKPTSAQLAELEYEAAYAAGQDLSVPATAEDAPAREGGADKKNGS